MYVCETSRPQLGTSGDTGVKVNNFGAPKKVLPKKHNTEAASSKYLCTVKHAKVESSFTA